LGSGSLALLSVRKALKGRDQVHEEEVLPSPRGEGGPQPALSPAGAGGVKGQATPKLKLGLSDQKLPSQPSQSQVTFCLTSSIGYARLHSEC